jgi:molecular chaperone GrpE (heat shock protein)
LVPGNSTGGQSATAHSKVELAERHFGFPPVAFVDDVWNACNDYAYDGVDYVERKLRDVLAKQKVKSAASADITAGADAVLENLQRSLDVNLDRFELYSLQNLFVVPSSTSSSSTAAMPLRSFANNDDDNDDDDRNDKESANKRPRNAARSSATAAVAASDVDSGGAGASAEAEAEVDAELERLLLIAEELQQANDLLRASIQQTRADTAAIRPLVDACRPIQSADHAPAAALSAAFEQLDKLRQQHIETKALFDSSAAAGQQN